MRRIRFTFIVGGRVDLEGEVELAAVLEMPLRWFRNVPTTREMVYTRLANGQRVVLEAQRFDSQLIFEPVD